MIGDDRDILAHVIGYLQGLSDGSDPIDPRKLWLVWSATIGTSEIGSRM